MQRRAFLRKGAVSTAVLAAGSRALSARVPGPASDDPPGRHLFKLKYAPHLGMFRQHAGEDPLDQLQFMADVGFRAFEDNDMKKREIHLQEAIASKIATLGMDMGVFVAHTIRWSEPGLSAGDPDMLREFLDEIRGSVVVAKRVNARWMTVVPGFMDYRKDKDYQTANVISALRRAAEILEPHGLVMVLEPLNFRDHPGQFLKTVPQAYAICRAVGSPSCRILDDLYHQQIQAGNLIPNMDLAWEEIAYFQVGDNPGRKEPTTGEINYRNVFGHIHKKGYTGIIGMEHGNSLPGKEGELALIRAYAEVDDF